MVLVVGAAESPEPPVHAARSTTNPATIASARERATGDRGAERDTARRLATAIGREAPPGAQYDLVVASHSDVEATLAERLGYAPGSKLLIVTCDDLGLTHSTNVAVYDAVRNGVATSASLMVPCPWARDAAGRYRGEDVGVHLTLNAELEPYRWGPITHSPSLLDGDGGFPAPSKTPGTTPTSTRYAANAGPRSSGRSCGAST